ncbi:MAG: ParB/RepB/Spo0J family partition protein [Desulfobacterales bacterium]
MKKEKSGKTSGARPKRGKKIALGRGLDALLPPGETLPDPSQTYFQCDIDRIQPNRFQPRQRFSEVELTELSDSIKEQGIIQPLLVRADNGRYELIAGERRLRAAKMAGLRQVPVLVKEVADTDILELAIIENIQRENLNPIEEADAYHRLIEEFHLTQDQAAIRVGKSRSAVANLMRLRQLSGQIRESLIDGRLSTGHARALLGADGPTKQRIAWRAVLEKKLSVRETEALVKRVNAEKERPKQPDKPSEDILLLDIADELSRRFGTKVQIKKRGQRGKVQIDFYSDDDLDRLIDLLKQP